MHIVCVMSSVNHDDVLCQMAEQITVGHFIFR